MITKPPAVKKKIAKKKSITPKKLKEKPQDQTPKVTFHEVYSWALKIEYGGEYQDVNDNIVKPNIIIGIRVLTERKTERKIGIDLAGAPVNNFEEAATTLIDRVRKWFQFHYPKQDPDLNDLILNNITLKTKYESWLKCKSQTLRTEMCFEIGKY